jgi:hypothetical protein
MIKALDQEGSLAGAREQISYMIQPYCRLLKKTDQGSGGYDDNLNKELIASIAPDLVMVLLCWRRISGIHRQALRDGSKSTIQCNYLKMSLLVKQSG